MSLYIKTAVNKLRVTNFYFHDKFHEVFLKVFKMSIWQLSNLIKSQIFVFRITLLEYFDNIL